MDFASLLPSTFEDAVGAVIIVIAALFLFLSIIESLRPHSAKISAVLFIVGLALVAKSVPIYFVGILVIATAVTELEFIQNIAAIVRGSPEYFDYKKEELSPAEKEEKHQSFVNEQERDTETTKDQGIGFRSYSELEDALFPVLAAHLGRGIEISVRYESPIKGAIEFDGIITYPKDPDLLIEVKYVRSEEQVKNILGNLQEYEKRTIRFLRITGRTARMLIVLVVDKLEDSAWESMVKIQNKILESERIAGVATYSIAELTPKDGAV